MKPVTGYWWTQAKDKAGPDAHQSCLGIQARQQDRYAAQLRWGELYSGTTLSSLYTYDEKASAVSAHHDRSTSSSRALTVASTRSQRTVRVPSS
jgi:hypothetical protein